MAVRKTIPEIEAIGSAHSDDNVDACLPQRDRAVRLRAMVFLLRFFLVLAKSAFRRRLDPLAESVITMRVWPNDLDLNMHMNSGRYLSAIDLGRVNILARAGVLRRVLARGWRPIAGATMIRFRRSLLPFEKFEVRSRVLCWDDKWFYFEHRVERHGELYALAHVRGLLRGPEGNVAPVELLRFGGAANLTSPEIPEFIRLWNAAEELR